MKVKITDLKVREERQRKDMGDIQELALSMSNDRIGQIQPIIIDENNYVLAGERRFRAAQMLDWSEIEARLVSDLTPSEKFLLEHEENVKRKALEWPEHVAAVKYYHELRIAEDSEHSALKTALELGLSPTKVNKDLLIAAEVEANPETAGIKKYGQAYDKSVRRKEREQSLDLSGIDLGIELGGAPLATSSPSGNRAAQLLHASFIKWAEEYSGPKFDFIHCDFPYGIDLHTAGDKLRDDSHTSYVDEEQSFITLCEAFAMHLDKFAAPHATIMFWYATRRMPNVRKHFLTPAGLHWFTSPLIWHKVCGRGVTPDTRYFPKHVYETALVCWRPEERRTIGKVVNDVVGCRVVNQLHRSEKPMPVLRHFFEMFIDDKTLMLDPTCGCGNAVKVAESFGAKLALGIEVNEEIYKVAKENLML